MNTRVECYLVNLYHQYLKVKGIQVEEITDDDLLSIDFLAWVANNKKILKEYRDYLDYLGYLDGKKITEVGKGRYDTIPIKGKKIVSPYAKMISPNLRNFTPYIVDGEFYATTTRGNVYPINTDIILTHNPYINNCSLDGNDIEFWADVHNRGQYEINIGVYGTIHDKDYREKLDLIDDIRYRMDNDYKYNYDESGDHYFCTIKSLKLKKGD